MADEGKKKKFVVEEVVGDEPVHSEDLDKEIKINGSPEEAPAAEAETPQENSEDLESKDSSEKMDEIPEVKEDSEEKTPEPEETSEMKATEESVEPEGEMSAEPSPRMPEHKTNMKLVILLTAFIALILGGVAGGVLVFLSGDTAEKSTDASPTPIANAEATPTPEPEVDKQSVTVNIQNGSGIAGEGGRMSELLTGEGFKVGTVGNASSFDHEETIIQAKDSVSESFLDLLSETLSKKYKIGDSTKLTSGNADVVVVIGSEKP